MDDRELLRRIAAAVGVTSTASVTVGALFRLYKTSRGRGRAWQLERNLLRPFVVRFWRRPVDSLGPADWDEHRARRRKEKTRLGRKPSDLTINLELARAKYMLKWGTKRKHISHNPLLDCRPVKTRSRRGSWFTEPQIDMLAAASMALRWEQQRKTFRALTVVMSRTGLRISEALGIRWDRITLEGTTAVVGKGSKRRVIGFPPEAIKAMGTLDRHPICPFVFVNYRKGAPYDASTVRRWFHDAIKASGLESVKAHGDIALVPHILRHSAASMADERGAPLTLIQNMLGHSSSETTKVYLHRDETNAAIRMARIMSNRKPPRRAASRIASIPEKDIVKRVRRGVGFFS